MRISLSKQNQVSILDHDVFSETFRHDFSIFIRNIDLIKRCLLF